MKPAKPIVLIALGLTAFAVPAQSASHPKNSPTTSGRAVRVEGDVNAPASEVWRVFSTSDGAEEFFAQKANIGLAIGGPYEIQFDPKDERSGTRGLKILVMLRKR